MKSIGEIGLCAVLAAFANMVALADTETVDGVTWTYTVSNGEVSLGGGSFDCTAVPTSTSGDITIPSSLGGYPVTSIGDSAFYGCCRLGELVLRGRTEGEVHVMEDYPWGIGNTYIIRCEP